MRPNYNENQSHVFYLYMYTKIHLLVRHYGGAKSWEGF